MEYRNKRKLATSLVRKLIKGVKKTLKPKEPVLSPIQLWALRVTKATIRAESSTLLIDPITGARYARYGEYKIKFGSNFVFINRIFKDANGHPQSMPNYIALNYTSGEKLIDFFNHRVSSRRQAMEQEDDYFTMENLKQMYEQITK